MTGHMKAAELIGTLRCLLVLAVAGLLGTACGSGSVAAPFARPPDFLPKDQSKCRVTKSRLHPLIVEWPSADRQEVEAKIRTGVVAVRYAGCEMEVLGRCTVPAKYLYVGTTRKEDKVVVKDEDELYANLPVGAAGLETKLQKSGKLTVAMSLVGRYVADRDTVRADELQGDCARATHFVYGVAVGAFDFYAGGEADIGADVGVMGAGSGAHSRAEREDLSKDGDITACTRSSGSDKEPPDGCGALVRLDVVSLGEPKKLEKECPDGSGWDGKRCVVKKVVMEVDCPGGAKWDGAKCIAPAPQALPRVMARISNIDDKAFIIVNGVEALRGAWGRGAENAGIGHQPGDTGLVDISRFVRGGPNEVRLRVWNEPICCGVSGTFEIIVAGQKRIDRRFKKEDSTPGYKFDEIVTLQLP